MIKIIVVDDYDVNDVIKKIINLSNKGYHFKNIIASNGGEDVAIILASTQKITIKDINKIKKEIANG